jgi:hypothetical protein
VADAESTAQPLVPVEMVEGVLCTGGHLNRPGSTSCTLCGTPLDDARERVVQPRPPLGVLVTDTGAVYTLLGDYVIGRDPQQSPDVQAGRALPLPLRDAEHSTSRVHAHIRVSGWDVLVSDGASANGTFISRDGASGPWTPVPREPGTALQPGDRVKVGNRQLLFDRYQQPLNP